MITQQKPAKPHWHQTLNAYHEAGHALVAHVLGCCISEVSIVPKRGKGYQGYTAHDRWAESMHEVLLWQEDAPLNEEQIAVLYAGTMAMKLICQERGWNYEYWRKTDRDDLLQIEQLTMWFVPEDESVYDEWMRDCWNLAQRTLKRSWRAVEALATVLVTRQQVPGWEVHRLIQHAIDPSVRDWRMEQGESRRITARALDKAARRLRR
jgi:hypothetical protein